VLSLVKLISMIFHVNKVTQLPTYLFYSSLFQFYSSLFQFYCFFGVFPFELPGITIVDVKLAILITYNAIGILFPI